jgi:hypothetical protein
MWFSAWAEISMGPHAPPSSTEPTAVAADDNKVYRVDPVEGTLVGANVSDGSGRAVLANGPPTPSLVATDRGDVYCESSQLQDAE